MSEEEQCLIVCTSDGIIALVSDETRKIVWKTRTQRHLLTACAWPRKFCRDATTPIGAIVSWDGTTLIINQTGTIAAVSINEEISAFACGFLSPNRRGFTLVYVTVLGEVFLAPNFHFHSDLLDMHAIISNMDSLLNSHSSTMSTTNSTALHVKNGHRQHESSALAARAAQLHRHLYEFF